MSKLVLNDLSSLTNEQTALTTINQNTASIEDEFDNTLSLDGSQPNQMLANLDMNSNRILNLPSAVSDLEPLRLTDLDEFINGSVTFNNLPTGGTSGQVLKKNSSSNYDFNWGTLAGTDLSSILASSVLYTAPGTGGTQRTLDARLRDVVNAKDYGATGDGVTDDSDALIHAAAKAASTGAPLFIPGGQYQVSKTIDLSGNGLVYGGGAGSVTQIRVTSATADIFSKNHIIPICIRDLEIMNNPGLIRTAGDYIVIDSSSNGGALNDSVINCVLASPYNGIHVKGSSPYLISCCAITECQHTGIFIENIYDADAGDGAITSNYITLAAGLGIGCVFWASSGGMKTIGNKFLGGGDGDGIVFQPAGSGVATSIFPIEGNSIEHCTNGIHFVKNAGTSNLAYPIITGNQINCEVCILFDSPLTDWISKGIIANNTLTYGATGGVILNSGTQIHVHDNTFYSTVLNATGLTTGASFPTATLVGMNQFINTVNFYTFNSNPGVFLYQDVYVTGTIPLTVAQLPTASALLKGQRMFVTDADSTTFHATAVGGGANNVGVVCNGTVWYIG